jgi:hypothetical protein
LARKRKLSSKARVEISTQQGRLVMSLFKF